MPTGRRHASVAIDDSEATHGQPKHAESGPRLARSIEAPGRQARAFGGSGGARHPASGVERGGRSRFRRPGGRFSRAHREATAHPCRGIASRKPRGPVKTFVIDASGVIKWVTEERGTKEALGL